MGATVFNVEILQKDPSSAPLIECGLLGGEADVETLARGLLMIRRIMAAEPIVSLLETAQ
jgi:hypothetical protein